MPSNPYFRQFRVRTEQDLIDDLTREAIEIHGIDMLYLPRAKVNVDILYGEDVLSKFDDYYDMVMYIENVDNFQGDGDFLSKFGLEIRNQSTLVLSKTEFDEKTNHELSRPREGDLIYDPLTKSLFEIKFTEHEQPFFQLGDLPVYKLTVETFVYGHEKLDTGLEEIDKIEDKYSYTLQMNIGTGTGSYEEGEFVFQGTDLNNATAKAEVVCYNIPPNTLKVINVFGDFTLDNGNVIGDESGASYELTDNPDEKDAKDSNLLTDNKFIEDEAKRYIDFSEKDLFGFVKDNE